MLSAQVPSADVSGAFGASGDPALLPGGKGVAWRVGDVVLNPAPEAEKAGWVADLFSGLAGPGFRVSRPVRSQSGGWLVEVGRRGAQSPASLAWCSIGARSLPPPMPAMPPLPPATGGSTTTAGSLPSMPRVVPHRSTGRGRARRATRPGSPGSSRCWRRPGRASPLCSTCAAGGSPPPCRGLPASSASRLAARHPCEQAGRAI